MHRSAKTARLFHYRERATNLRIDITFLTRVDPRYYSRPQSNERLEASRLLICEVTQTPRYNRQGRR
jgi:hypothetical protein